MKSNYTIESIFEGRQYILKEDFRGETIVLGKFKTKEEAEKYSKNIDEARAVYRGDISG